MFTQVAQDVAAPFLEPADDTATPEAVDVSHAYVYLFRVVVAAPQTDPIAKIPLVLLPAAAL